MAAVTTYTFTAENGAVLITNTLGYITYWQGFTNISGSKVIQSTGLPIVMMQNTQHGQLQIPFDLIGTIGGDAPSSTLAGVLAQLNQLFKTAYAQNGGGGGSSVQTLAYAVGTPPAFPNVSYIAVPNGSTITDGALSGKTILAIIVGNVFNEPVTSTGYSFSGTTITFVSPLADINVYVICA